MTMNAIESDLFPVAVEIKPGSVAPAKRRCAGAGWSLKQFKVLTLREVPAPESLKRLEGADQAAEYWHTAIATDDRFNGDVESFYVLLLNARRRCFAHVLVSQGTLDTILVHPREVFRAALIGNASAVIVMHNHPSGDPTPSEADIKVTRDLIRAGQLLKVELLDHVVIGKAAEGAKGYCSLRELGYFYQ